VETILIIIQLIFLEGILSLDNAAILGALASRLPDDQPVPFPSSLHSLEKPMKRLLGMQQTAVLRIGLLFAYLGRGVLLFAAEWIQRSIVLETIGAAYLIWLGLKNLKPAADDQPDSISSKVSTRSFWLLVLQVEIIDLIFSLDNVIAAVALSPDYWVVLLGVAIGILVMRFAAGLFARLVNWEPILETAAYLIIIAIGIELLLSEYTGITFAAWQKLGISTAVIAICLLYARLPNCNKKCTHVDSS
jgi:tellurite resistance protein TerC